MAFCPTEEKIYGYEDSRFEKDVDENFHCSICRNVLKDPRMCRNNEHIFCLACISEHLRVNSRTCPECSEHLSVDTLRRARLASNYLSKLKINCDHASRGCAELTCLENLETHVANCGYASVLCSNPECGMVINKRERVHHETEISQYRRRKVKCHDCGQIQEDVGTLKGSLIELNGKVEAANKEMTKTVAKLEGSLKELDGKVMKAVKNSQDQTRQDQQEIKKEVKDVKVSISKVNKDVDKVKVITSQVLEKLNMLEQLNKLPSPTEGMLKTPREDMLIASGRALSNNSTEIYSWEKNGWFEVSTMNKGHCGASSFIYNYRLFVVGGAGTKTIETLDLNELLLKWMKYPGKLPYRGDDHQTVAYQQRIIHIGGYNYDQRWSGMISELQLTSPVSMKKLCQMPDPRFRHGAETFEDKVLILGGEDRNSRPLNSVLEFDVKKNECKEMPPLPHPVTRMATVRWRDQVVVLGGRGKHRQALNDVFMYDCKTGKTTALPSMLEKRFGCCAVITGNTIVVMGGANERDLNSVECFTMRGYTWEYLPATNKARYGAVAEVLPPTRKYV
jgi:gas vesicle protein